MQPQMRFTDLKASRINIRCYLPAKISIQKQKWHTLKAMYAEITEVVEEV